MLQSLDPDLRLVARSTPLGRNLDRIDLAPFVSPRQVRNKRDQVTVVVRQLQEVLADIIRAVVGLEPGRDIDPRWALFVIVAGFFESYDRGKVALALDLGFVDGRWERRGAARVNSDGLVEDGNG